MSAFVKVAEAKIQESLENGEFENLPGMGLPLDLDSYFSCPSAIRAGFGVLKSAGAVPPEVSAMAEIALLRERIANPQTDAAFLPMLNKELQTRETEVAMAMERMKKSIRQDATT